MFVHRSLDIYAFIALTASAPTLDGLVNMVQADNDRRQQELDAVGAPHRALNVNTRLFDVVLRFTLILSNSSPYQASTRNTSL